MSLVVLRRLVRARDLLHAEAQRGPSLDELAALGGGVLVTDNLDREYEELKAKGVKFPQPPAKNPWGYSAVLEDDSGNYFSISENDE